MKILCSVRDLKAGLYNAPVAYPTPAAAVRDFIDLLSDKGSVLNKHPEDYELRQIGSFDEGSGEVFPFVPSTLLFSGEANG